MCQDVVVLGLVGLGLTAVGLMGMAIVTRSRWGALLGSLTGAGYALGLGWYCGMFG